MNKLLLSLSLLILSLGHLTAQLIQLQNIASGFELPVAIVNANDDRLFVVEKRGVIKSLRIDSCNLAPLEFMDIQNLVLDDESERGLLGLCFHPQFDQNGHFFVNYIDQNGHTQVSRFTTLTDGQVDLNSELSILKIEQPFKNHNGGSINFGPDGYLYMAIGDGGGDDDPSLNGQNRTTLLSKMIRIDINTNLGYSIPEDNPFANDDFTLDEIWAIGLRNPWKFSFDRLTGDLWLGDVGQNSFEELNFQAANSEGGENYGWSCFEADSIFMSLNGCENSSDFTFPFFNYITDIEALGCSVTGGYVYRGLEYPALYGKYIFGDFCTGQLWTSSRSNNGHFYTQVDNRIEDLFISSFGEDANGELYVANYYDGEIFKIGSDCNFNLHANVEDSNCFLNQDGQIELLIEGSDNYTIEWSNGESSEILMVNDSGNYCATVIDLDSGCQQEFCANVNSNNTHPSFENINFPDISFCNGVNTLLLSFQFEYSAIWYLNGEPIELEDVGLVNVASAGIYSVQFFDDTCISDLIELFEATMIVPATPQISYDETSQILTATIGYESYEWYRDGQFFMQSTSNFIELNESGEYSVVAIDENGCPSNLSEVELLTISNLLDIKELRLFELNPNPFTNHFNLKLALTKTTDIEIKVVDFSGKVIHSRFYYESNLLDEVLVATDWASGTYFLRISLSGQFFVTKLIKI